MHLSNTICLYIGEPGALETFGRLSPERVSQINRMTASWAFNLVIAPEDTQCCSIVEEIRKNPARGGSVAVFPWKFSSTDRTAG